MEGGCTGRWQALEQAAPACTAPFVGGSHGAAAGSWRASPAADVSEQDAPAASLALRLVSAEKLDHSAHRALQEAGGACCTVADLTRWSMHPSRTALRHKSVWRVFLDSQIHSSLCTLPY